MKKMIVCAVIAGLFSGVASAKELTTSEKDAAIAGGVAVGGVTLGITAYMNRDKFYKAYINHAYGGKDISFTEAQERYMQDGFNRTEEQQFEKYIQLRDKLDIHNIESTKIAKQIRIKYDEKPPFRGPAAKEFMQEAAINPDIEPTNAYYLKKQIKFIENKYPSFKNKYDEQKSALLEKEAVNGNSGVSLNQVSNDPAENIQKANLADSGDITKGAIDNAGNINTENKAGEAADVKNEVEKEDSLAKDLEEGAEGAK